MKAPKDVSNHDFFATVPGDKSKRKAFIKTTVKSIEEPSPKTRTKVRQTPAIKDMLLNDEIGRKWKNPRWSTVERLIRELDPGRFNSFACMSVPGNNYIQCLHGFNGWHLEWRITNPSGSYVHYRASYPGASKKAFELKKHDFVSQGQYRDLLHLEDVIDAFRSFHQDEGLPGFLKWRVLTV